MTGATIMKMVRADNPKRARKITPDRHAIRHGLSGAQQDAERQFECGVAFQLEVRYFFCAFCTKPRAAGHG